MGGQSLRNVLPGVSSRSHAERKEFAAKGTTTLLLGDLFSGGVGVEESKGEAIMVPYLSQLPYRK